MCVSSRVCVHACVLFTRHSTACHAGATLRRGGTLLRFHSLCQARWLLSLKEEEESWKETGEGGSFESLSTVPEWPVPRAATSGDHLQLAFPASSILFPSPLSHSGFPDGGRWRQRQWSVWSDCDFSVFLLWVENRRGGRSGWKKDGKKRIRWQWRQSVAKYFSL